MRIRNRAILVLLLPIASVVFAAGWILQYFGERKYNYGSQRKQVALSNNGIQFRIATSEEPEEYDGMRADASHD